MTVVSPPPLPDPPKDITLEQLGNRVDQVVREVQRLADVMKKASRMTITDGIALGFGMFIALPIILFFVWFLLMVFGVSLGGFLRH